MSAATTVVLDHPLKRLIGRAPKALAVCGFVSSCIDLLEPLGPMAMYALLGSLFVLIITFPASRLLPFLSNEIGILRVTACMIFFMSVFLLVAQRLDPATADTGILAKNIPAAAEFQQQVLNIQHSVANIEKSTARTAEHTNEIASNSRQTVQELQGLKREVSNDPRKELANMGVKWEYDSLLEALSNQDYRVVEWCRLGCGGLLRGWRSLRVLQPTHRDSGVGARRSRGRPRHDGPYQQVTFCASDRAA